MTKRPTKKRSHISLPDGLTEVLYEFIPVGNILRVTAIDPKTRTEVIMVADPRYGEDTIKMLAARKLAYVLEKKKRHPDGSIWA